MQDLRGKQVPENFEEAFVELERLLKEYNELEPFQKLSGDALVKYHHTLGRHLRNIWGLWSGSNLKKYMENQGFIHADDMSSAMLLFTHRNENGVPLKIEEVVAKYKEYWNNMEEAEGE